jgi:hypothetical protein
MAKLRPKSFQSQLAGRVGRFVYRRHGNQTVVQIRPDPNPKRSAAQKKRQSKFKEAAAWAKSILADALQRRIYQELGAARNQPPNALLIANFLNPPTVDLIEAAGYKRRRDDVIKVLATDEVEVVSVQVKIRDADNAVLEEGPATKVHGVWIYTATTNAPARESLTIEASATDRPGNSATESIRL